MPTTAIARIATALARVLPRPVQKADVAGGYWLPISGGWLPGNSPWNFWQLGWDPVSGGRGAVVSACVAAYAQTVAMCPGTHWRRLANNGRERVTNSDLSRILKKPNAYQSTSDFFLNLTSSLYDHGNAYALAVRNNRYEIAEVHLMNARTSLPRIAATGDLFYALAGNPIVEKQIPAEVLGAVPARDVLHVKLNVNQQYRLTGEPPLTAALIDVAASDALVRQALNYVQNQGRPSGVIYTDEPLDETQMRELSARWDEMTKGANAGRTPILSGGLKWEATAATSRDEQIAELLQISDQRIATAFRMPLALLSLAFGTTPSGSTENLIQFWLASGLGFCLNHIEDAMGRFFGLGGFPDEYLELDTTALERSNLKDRIDALARGVQGGIYSPNEARAREDLPAAEEGDEPRVQQQVVPLSFAGAAPPAPPAPPMPPPTPPEDQDNQPDGNAALFAATVIAAADWHGRRDAT
jgi:HK97 family phage portal protein